MNLSQLAKNRPAEVLGFAQTNSPTEEALIRAMCEMGICTGAHIEVLHAGLFNRDPLAVLCRGALIGIGKNEAQLVLVKEVSK